MAGYLGGRTQTSGSAPTADPWGKLPSLDEVSKWIDSVFGGESVQQPSAQQPAVTSPQAPAPLPTVAAPSGSATPQYAGPSLKSKPKAGAVDVSKGDWQQELGVSGESDTEDTGQSPDETPDENAPDTDENNAAPKDQSRAIDLGNGITLTFGGSGGKNLTREERRKQLLEAAQDRDWVAQQMGTGKYAPKTVKQQPGIFAKILAGQKLNAGDLLGLFQGGGNGGGLFGGRLAQRRAAATPPQYQPGASVSAQRMGRGRLGGGGFGAPGSADWEDQVRRSHGDVYRAATSSYGPDFYTGVSTPRGLVSGQTPPIPTRNPKRKKTNG